MRHKKPRETRDSQAMTFDIARQRRPREADRFFSFSLTLKKGFVAESEGVRRPSKLNKKPIASREPTATNACVNLTVPNLSETIMSSYWYY